MSSNQLTKFFTDDQIVEKIYTVRGQRVMLDRDLAEMYGIETKVLKQAVKRNRQRFPEDFMFEMAPDEFTNWRSQFVMSKSDKMGLRHPPFCFTEQGVAMLSSVLRSETAIQVNIQIIRVYTRMKQLLVNYKEIWQKIETIEQSLVQKDEEIQSIFNILKQLLVKEATPREPIGFQIPKKNEDV